MPGCGSGDAECAAQQREASCLKSALLRDKWEVSEYVHVWEIDEATLRGSSGDGSRNSEIRNFCDILGKTTPLSGLLVRGRQMANLRGGGKC